MPAECVILPDGVYLLSMYANIITMTYTFYQRKIKLASSKSFFFLAIWVPGYFTDTFSWCLPTLVIDVILNKYLLVIRVLFDDKSQV